MFTAVAEQLQIHLTSRGCVECMAETSTNGPLQPHRCSGGVVADEPPHRVRPNPLPSTARGALPDASASGGFVGRHDPVGVTPEGRHKATPTYREPSTQARKSDDIIDSAPVGDRTQQIPARQRYAQSLSGTAAWSLYSTSPGIARSTIPKQLRPLRMATASAFAIHPELLCYIDEFWTRQ